MHPQPGGLLSVTPRLWSFASIIPRSPAEPLSQPTLRPPTLVHSWLHNTMQDPYSSDFELKLPGPHPDERTQWSYPGRSVLLPHWLALPLVDISSPRWCTTIVC